MAYGQTYEATFHNQTIRMIAHTSVSGSLPRVRLSNLYGSSPLTVGAVDLAQQSSTAGTAVTGTHRTVTFNGSTSVTISAPMRGGPVNGQAEMPGTCIRGLFIRGCPRAPGG
ncbi:hypothetical protein ABZW30_41680 [Kitasatospora sp. NPDC004669]|uniref:hypothetical protein n=1 Tax=Kitasatospora sp. NPDC004669 TaxID=3154555 RepID=UPI0033A18352